MRRRLCRFHRPVSHHLKRPEPLLRFGCHWLRQCALPNHKKALAKPVAPSSRGFTLLEVILALAILAGSLAALGEVMRLADRNAAAARDETQAQIIAASIMDELTAGARALTSITATPLDYETDTPWRYSVAIEQTAYNEMVAVRVLVEQDTDPRLQPARFQLERWLPNPDIIPQNTGAQSSTGSSAGSSSASSGSQTGTGGQP